MVNNIHVMRGEEQSRGGVDCRPPVPSAGEPVLAPGRRRLPPWLCDGSTPRLPDDAAPRRPARSRCHDV